MTLERASESEIDPRSSKLFVPPVFKLLDPVKAEARDAAPHRDITVAHTVSPDRIASLYATEFKCRRQAKRYGNDRLRQITLIFVLMKREPSARLVAIDEAGIRHKAGVTRIFGSGSRECKKRTRQGGPAAEGGE